MEKIKFDFKNMYYLISEGDIVFVLDREGAELLKRDVEENSATFFLTLCNSKGEWNYIPKDKILGILTYQDFIDLGEGSMGLRTRMKQAQEVGEWKKGEKKGFQKV